MVAGFIVSRENGHGVYGSKATQTAARICAWSGVADVHWDAVAELPALRMTRATRTEQTCGGCTEHLR